MLFTNKLLPSTLPNEKVILELRRHWFSFFRQAFIYLILLVGPLLAYYFIDKFAVEHFNGMHKFGGNTTFGHATKKGNILIAENLADVILRELDIHK